jgi:lipopolysaccharide exporter
MADNKAKKNKNTPNNMQKPQSSSLTSFVVTGSKWMILLRLLARSSTTIVSIILARLLAPADFGLIAVGLITISIIQVFSEVGFKQALVNETEVKIENMLDTVWTIEIMRGIIIFVVINIFANRAALFFNQPDAKVVIHALSVLPVLKSLTNIKIILFQKELDFKKQFIYEISGVVGPIFVSIPLAFILQNLWAIVLGQIFTNIFQLMVSYLMLPYYPKITLVKDHIARLFNFGKWIFVGSIISYIAMELDTIVAAMYFDAHMLGIYTLAFSISNKPIGEISKALSKVLFPTFSIIKNDLMRVKTAFLKSSTILYLVLTPMVIGLFLISEDFVRVLLGVKWVEVIEPMRILSLGMLFRILVIPAGGLFSGIGKPNIVMYIAVTRAISLGLGLSYVGTNISIESISYAVLISNMVSLLAFIYYLNGILRISIRDYFINYVATLFSLIVTIISVVTLQNYMNPGIFRLVFSVFAGVITYVSMILIIDHYTNRRLHNLFKIIIGA